MAVAEDRGYWIGAVIEGGCDGKANNPDHD
jgi:hypothetical protein